MKHSMKLTPVGIELFQFLEDVSIMPNETLTQVALETSKLPDAVMQIPKHQGAFLYLLMKLTKANHIVELGCYTGYSAIAMASALSKGGKLVTFDIDQKTSSLAERYFKLAGLETTIEIQLGNAVEKFRYYVEHTVNGPIDAVFIDADKVNYETYYELALKGLKSGGMILLDNAFRDGEILAPAIKDLGTQAVRRLIVKIRNDHRVEATMIPMADGLYLIRKI
ncbi:MAG: O-methyltransferase [Proteobacteria bacterium]|nr:O-methyltransferase [Pseudomonadota bacterium]